MCYGQMNKNQDFQMKVICIQFFHHIPPSIRNKSPVVNEVVVVPRRLAVRGRLHSHATLDKLVSLQRVEH